MFADAEEVWMTVPRVVLVDRSRRPQSPAGLARAAAALQTQVDRDFAPVWGTRARIEAAAGPTIPPDAWQISIVQRPARERFDRPGAEVASGEDWTLAASHALLAMIAAPRGDRTVPGPSLYPAAAGRQVRYLVEVCDPCQTFHYEVDGVVVSDFVTPDYYRPDAPAGTPVDFLRALTAPLEVPPGCCLSWLDAAGGHWRLRCEDPRDAR